jgi:hypothetical protein
MDERYEDSEQRRQLLERFASLKTAAANAENTAIKAAEKSPDEPIVHEAVSVFAELQEFVAIVEKDLS